MGCFSFKPREAEEEEEVYPLRDSGYQGAEGNLPKTAIDVTFGPGQIVSCHSGPDQGVGEVQTEWTLDWEKNSIPSACGRCESLYETDPNTKQRVGEPFADCFGTIAYPDGCALALADGVSWGAKPRCAARRAVYGALKGMNAVFKSLQGRTVSSHQVFNQLLKVVDSAQEFVVQDQQSTLTTLSMAMVVRRAGRGPPTWAVLALTIGDSPAYIYRAIDGEVEQVSYGMSTSSAYRDMRICPGALGWATGNKPDLGNLTLHLTVARPGDIVFLTSDGIADNFDPIVRKVAVPHRTYGSTRTMGSEKDTRPKMSFAVCQQKALEEMGERVREARGELAACSKVLVDSLMDFAVEATAAYRELCEQRTGTETEEEWTDKVAETPGKPDHAALVAYTVGTGNAKQPSIEL